MKYTLIFLLALASVGTVTAIARPIPIGERKYVIPEGPSERVKIVKESDQVKGNYMRDPMFGSGAVNDHGKSSHGSKKAAQPTPPTVVRVEKSFKPIRIEGRLLQPRVEFEREFLDIAQLEAISEPKFADRLMENLDALD